MDDETIFRLATIALCLAAGAYVLTVAMLQM